MTHTLPNIKLPLWLKYPHITQYSIGWRMGNGEEYKFELNDWFNTLLKSQQKEYAELFPLPKLWEYYYDDVEDDDYEKIDNLFFWHCDHPVFKWGDENGKPCYGLNELRTDITNGKHKEYLFFYGHQPATDGILSSTCLSQWWKAKFNVDTETYYCMEQYMMAEKARLFGDEEMECQIMQCAEPKTAKQLGRKVQGFSAEIWDKAKFSIVTTGNYYKFIENNALCEFLLNTGNAVLVEASPYDRIWGIGMSATHADVNNPLKWRGQNLLGFALMEVRTELRRILANKHLVNE